MSRRHRLASVLVAISVVAATGLVWWAGSSTATTPPPAAPVPPIPDDAAPANRVARLYAAAFLRPAEPSGLYGWTRELVSGRLSLEDLGGRFEASPEFQARYGSLSNRDFVRRVYLNVLNREPDAAGWSAWTAALDQSALTRGVVIAGFSDSTEFRARAAAVRYCLAWAPIPESTDPASQVARLYAAFFNRQADPPGLYSWTDALVTGQLGLTAVADRFAASAELRSVYGSLSNRDFVRRVYLNVLGREPDSQGWNTWTRALDDRSLTRGDVMVGFSESGEFRSGRAVNPPDVCSGSPVPPTAGLPLPPGGGGTPPPSGDCGPTSTPVGALPSQPPPVFCSIVNQGAGTALNGANSWVDNFDHGLSFADFSGTGYRLFDGGWLGNRVQWRHMNHWMVDIARHPSGGSEGMTMLRPDRTFRFENGRLVVEAVVAAGIEDYGGPVWPEILVTTGSTPDFTRNGTYGYEKFPEDWTLGCRLQSSGYPVCALKADNGRIGSDYSTRVYEIAPLQVSGTANYYAPFNGIQPHRFCSGTPMRDPDMGCRDLFRLELTETSLTLFVNGVKYFEQTGLPRFPVAAEDVYVYFPSVVVGMTQGEVARFHWDRIAVNP